MHRLPIGPTGHASPTTADRPAPARWEAVLGLVVVIVAIAAVLSRSSPGSYGYNLFTDRDFARALRWRDELPVSGAELTGSFGARVPGAALGVAFWAGSWLGPDTEGPFRLVLAGLAASALVVYGGVLRMLGPWGAATAAVLWVSHPLFASVLADLWNPSFLPLPLAMAVAGVAHAVRSDRPQGLVVAAGAAAIAAQFHLGVAVWVGAFVPGLALLRPALVRAAAVPGICTMLAAYGPFLVVDLARGAPDLIALGNQLAATVSGVGSSTGDHAAARGFDVPQLFGGLAPGPWSTPFTLVACALPLLGLRWRRPLPRDVFVLLFVVQLALGIAIHTWGSRYAIQTRYLVGGIGATVLLPGLGVSLLTGWSTRARWVHALWVPAVLTMAWEARRPVWRSAWPGVSDPMSAAALTEVLDNLQQKLGKPISELARRSAWIVVPGSQNPAEWPSYPALDHTLALEGRVWQGSGESPCVLVFRPQHGDTQLDVTPATVQRWMGSSTPVELLSAPWQPHPGWTAVLYREGDAACRTTTGQRYVPTAFERETREVWEALPPASAAPLLGGSGRFGAHLVRSSDGQQSTWVAVELVDDGTQLTVTLHSNQLRGMAEGDGWFETRSLWRPTLTLTQGDQRVEVVIEPGLVGGRGANTPLSALAPSPSPGPWTVHLSATLVDARPDAPDIARPEDAVSILLGTVQLPIR